MKKDKKVKDTKKPLTRNEVRRIRYQIYRDAGYSVEEASRLRSRSLDVSTVRLTKTGSIDKRTRVYKSMVSERYTEKRFDKYKENIKYTSTDDKTFLNKDINDTTLSDWGYLTYHKEDEIYDSKRAKYRDDTARMVKYISKDMKVNNKQAQYMLYYMLSNDLTYFEAKEQMYVDPLFEIYRTTRSVKKYRKTKNLDRKLSKIPEIRPINLNKMRGK